MNLSISCNWVEHSKLYYVQDEILKGTKDTHIFISRFLEQVGFPGHRASVTLHHKCSISHGKRMADFNIAVKCTQKNSVAVLAQDIGFFTKREVISVHPPSSSR